MLSCRLFPRRSSPQPEHAHFTNTYMTHRESVTNWQHWLTHAVMPCHVSIIKLPFRHSFISPSFKWLIVCLLALRLDFDVALAQKFEPFHLLLVTVRRRWHKYDDRKYNNICLALVLEREEYLVSQYVLNESGLHARKRGWWLMGHGNSLVWMKIGSNCTSIPFIVVVKEGRLF